MAGFGAHGEGLPFSQQLMCLARRDRKHSEIKRGDALHGENVKGADCDTILPAVTTAAVDDGEHCASFRLALAGKMRHKELDAGGYTQRE